jgi:DNA-binding CsgD family transcriptional regulator
MDTCKDAHFPMLFEITMQMFFGQDVCNIASQVGNEKHRKEWYRKVLRKIIKETQKIDTSTNHKESIAHWSESALKVLSERHFNETKFCLYLLGLVGSLLGFVAAGTAPVYLRTFSTEAMSRGIDMTELMRDYNNNSITVRRRIINQLKEEGLDDFQIALVLNTSEYQVKKLRKQI